MPVKTKAEPGCGMTVKVVLMSALFGLLICIVLMIPVSLVISNEIIEPELAVTLSAVAVFIGGFVSSAVSSGNRGALLRGIVVSASMYILILTIGAIAFKGMAGWRPAILKLASALAGGVAGAMAKSGGTRRMKR